MKSSSLGMCIAELYACLMVAHGVTIDVIAIDH